LNKTKARYKSIQFAVKIEINKTDFLMSKEPAISVNSISKTYKLYHSRYDIVKEFATPLGRKYHKKFEALNDISFDVEKGEVLGIIGQNGSGKSTLLKILASVVTQTSGDFLCNGRVTALLELGGGFNMELSGIENIYYLGAIQGYSKKEMAGKLQKILDFADIGEYAFQPVNTYSSGMYVRLAFSMAINIDPDILITDEALSVGDIRFQQKCFRKIREFKEAGKTILLCTHSLAAIKDFCTRAIWLHEGEIKAQGDPIFVTESYNTFMLSQNSQAAALSPNEKSETDKQQNYPIEFPELAWQDLSNCESYGIGKADIQFAALAVRTTLTQINELKGGEQLRIFLKIHMEDKSERTGLKLTMNGNFGGSVLKMNSLQYSQNLSLKTGVSQIVAIDFDFPHIGNGRYTFSFGVITIVNKVEQQLHWVHDGLIIEVNNPGILYKTGSQIVIREASFKVLD
jgi:ABC-type polysaccharide/polyol phosphate transport system ATPase subunit